MINEVTICAEHRNALLTASCMCGCRTGEEAMGFVADMLEASLYTSPCTASGARRSRTSASVAVTRFPRALSMRRRSPLSPWRERFNHPRLN